MEFHIYFTALKHERSHAHEYDVECSEYRKYHLKRDKTFIWH